MLYQHIKRYGLHYPTLSPFLLKTLQHKKRLPLYTRNNNLKKRKNPGIAPRILFTFVRLQLRGIDHGLAEGRDVTSEAGYVLE
jgi:hypothetical protein